VKVPFVDLTAQYISIKAEIDSAIQEVIESASFIGGPAVDDFERAFAKYQVCNDCISCGNGTDALEIALEALEIVDGDEVIVPASTWVSTASAVHAVGGKPVFVDVHPDYYTMDVEKLKEKITPKTRAIIPVHYYGLPADMIAIATLANENGLAVVEDCAQAHGADISGKKVGGFGNLATFSFYPAKNLGAYGDAGCILTNDSKLAEKCRTIARLGQKGKHNHVAFGRNSRMDGLQAAILNVKLKHLDKWIGERREIAARYIELLDDSMLEVPKSPTGFNHVFHLFVIQVDNRDRLTGHLAGHGISNQIHYPKPVPVVPPYDQPGEDYPVSTRLSKRILSLPMYPELEPDQIEYVAENVNRFLQDDLG